MNMHTYNTNSPAHPKLTFWLVVISMGISAGIGWFCSWVQSAWGFTLGGFSSMSIFGVLYFVFNRWLWRFDWLKNILLVPNLNGTWIVSGQTTKRDGQKASTDWDGILTIVQSWTKLSVHLKTRQSGSRSITASLYRYEGEGFRLLYHYDNSPNANELSLNRHSGECDLMFSEDISTASGEYFTDKSRQTAGTIKLTRKGFKSE